ncbi:hypothetical protein [Niveispirillum sp.]|uniref:hypothetical protein n=1 Tax=Niveispirillum sp. TaxID=1917217 RepID=UPI001B499348|nr:hypothetical protein [Niveispirillum sp.]MBP7340490.1 hypothetical protein [Niveispirillum sp.]
MVRQRPIDKIKTLEQQIQQLQEQKKAAEAQQREAERKADTRRKIIVGALALEHWAKNKESDFAKTLDHLVDEYVIKPHERALFPELPPLPANGGTPAAGPDDASSS